MYFNFNNVLEVFSSLWLVQLENLQLLKSTAQFWTSNGYKTKSISHLMITVAL